MDLRRTYSVGADWKRRKSYPSILTRRNTEIFPTERPKLSHRSRRHTDIFPSDLPVQFEEPDFGLKSKSTSSSMKRISTSPIALRQGMNGLSPFHRGSSPGSMCNLPQGLPVCSVNGHTSVVKDRERARHCSSGSSYISDEAEMTTIDETVSANFFDFDEDADDIYLAPPEDYLQKMRKEEKKRKSQKQTSITAEPFTPLNVETIGGAYVEREKEDSVKGHSRRGSKTSDLLAFSLAESPLKQSTKLLITQPTPPDTPTIQDLIERDEKIAQLERKIEELRVMRWDPPPIPNTINRILTGQSYCLEWYKSLEQKQALLDAAIDTYDGNCITTVLLFIRKTLNPHFLMKLLQLRPIAKNHYCCFLKKLHAYDELMSMYQKLGDYESLGYLKLRKCESARDADQRVKQLQTCQIMFKTTPALEKDARYIEEYVKLTKKQKDIEVRESKGAARIKVGLMFEPLTTTLLYCCRYHGSAPENHVCCPEALRNMFSVNEKQYFQVCLSGFALAQNWEAVENLLTTKGKLGFGKKRKSPIGFERVVRTLGNPNTKRVPDEVLTKYLLEIDDLENRLSLATYTQVYEIGIETLKQMKDRERLRNYINQIPISKQERYRGKIRALIDNSQIKWKSH